MKVKNQDPETPCTDFEWLIGPFVDGELPVGEVKKLEGHLDECPSCRTLADQFRNLDALASKSVAEPPPVSAEEWGAMWDGIKHEGQTARTRPTRSVMPWVVRGIAVAALLILGVFVLYQAINFEPQTEPPVSYDEGDETPRIEWDDDGTVIDFTETNG